jgi:hypothetical protein
MRGCGVGAAVGGTRIETAICAAVGTLVGTATGSGAGVTAITACVGAGFGASEAAGAGVGFGGAVGANFASSCRTRGCGGAERGCVIARVLGTTGACGIGTATFTAGALLGTGRVLTVIIMPPGTDSGACCDDDVATEKTKSAISA